MTKVYYREYYGRALISVEGHSGFAPSGSDPVCAGISTLVFTLINSLTDEEGDGRLKLHRRVIRDGFALLEIEKFDFSKERTEGILSTFLTGAMMLQESYPDYIRVE